MPEPVAEKQAWLRTPARILAVLTILIMGFGVWQGVRALSTEAAQQRLAPTLNWEAFLAGRFAAAINHVMAHNLPLDAELRAAGGVFRWALFRSGGPQVRVGCEGWLFLTEELRPFPGAEAAIAERAAALGRVQRMLAERGIALVVALVPDKARIYPDKLCGAPWSAQSQGRLAAILAAFRAEGVEALDLAPVLAAAAARGPAHWRTDTHWNQEGAAAAAAAIAARAAGLAYDRREGIRTSFAAEESEAPADLLRLMGLDIVPDGLRPRRDRQRLAITTLPESGGGLLDDEALPQVALLGSSYSANANFHGALQQALAAPVTAIAQQGGGFHGAAEAFFGGATWRESPPRLIVWEFPERVVHQPITPAERAFLDRWR
ncbi:alginate O-acetyltransferase AlgX-related protein [Rubritepida flocculans]|uniref:alginate O-acetyltransferase AlgX-related protein n=1 Tax=Rubritepida flocculans TaxID=182403 RepID=UPI00041B625B|nr:cell division protein FtsQ [Rubritepida flocculans]